MFDRGKLGLLIVAGVVFVSIILDQIGVFTKLGLNQEFLVWLGVALLIVLAAIWSKNRALVTAALVFTVVMAGAKLALVFGLPKGDEWYFYLLDLILPAVLLGMALWRKNINIAIASSFFLIAFFIKMLLQLGIADFEMLWVFQSLYILGLFVLLYEGLKQTTFDHWSKFLSVLGILLALVLAFVVRLDGIYSTVWIGLALVGSCCAAFEIITNRGGKIAVCAMLLALYPSITSAPYWITWVAFPIMVGGFMVLAYHLIPETSIDEVSTEE